MISSARSVISATLAAMVSRSVVMVVVSWGLGWVVWVERTLPCLPGQEGPDRLGSVRGERRLPPQAHGRVVTVSLAATRSTISTTQSTGLLALAHRISGRGMMTVAPNFSALAGMAALASFIP